MSAHELDDDGGFPMIDPDKNTFVICLGRKGSGKSVHAREIFRGWPGVDRFVIDPTGDADPGDDLEPLTVRTLPSELPTRRDRRPVVMRYIADQESPTYEDDLDRAIGLALFPKSRRVLLWVDEAGEVFPSGKRKGRAHKLLHQSRHWNASLLLCSPRAITLDPLCLAQADRVVMYDIPNPDDRKRIAGAIGWPPAKLNDALDSLRTEPPHSFLLYVAAEHQLYLCPPMPMSSPDKKAGT